MVRRWLRPGCLVSTLGHRNHKGKSWIDEAMEKKKMIREEEEEEGMDREISKLREAAHVLLTKEGIHKYIIV